MVMRAALLTILALCVGCAANVAVPHHDDPVVDATPTVDAAIPDAQPVADAADAAIADTSPPALNDASAAVTGFVTASSILHRVDANTITITISDAALSCATNGALFTNIPAGSQAIVLRLWHPSPIKVGTYTLDAPGTYAESDETTIQSYMREPSCQIVTSGEATAGSIVITAVDEASIGGRFEATINGVIRRGSFRAAACDRVESVPCN